MYKLLLLQGDKKVVVIQDALEAASPSGEPPVKTFFKKFLQCGANNMCYIAIILECLTNLALLVPPLT